MGRSNGYRPKAAVRDEVLALRELLGTLRDDQWIKAGFVMQAITGLLGHGGGPSNGRIEPRACKYCKYYGHTRQWCKLRILHEEGREARYIAKILAEDAALGIGKVRPETEWSRWCKLADSTYRDLVDIKEEWGEEEWKLEFRKRAGSFDFKNECIIP